jgi:hypothetical protein
MLTPMPPTHPIFLVTISNAEEISQRYGYMPATTHCHINGKIKFGVTHPDGYSELNFEVNL